MKSPAQPTKRSAPPAPAAPAKRFTSATYADNTPERILLYADSGMGKSSLALIAPKPVFIALDEGVSKLRHPDTGAPADYIPGIDTFSDTRAALHQLDLFDPYKTVVVDTVTKLQDMAEPFVCETIPGEKGQKVKNLVGYGYNKGFKHLYDTMRFILTDCDELIRHGKNVILIAQAAPHTIANPGGTDFLRDGPRLHIDKSWSIEAMYCEWADHVLRIDYTDIFVDADDKKISGDTGRAIYAKPELHFRAKSRTIDEPIISFKDKADDSIWKFIFGGE